MVSEVNNTIECRKILFDIGHPAHVHLFKNLALYFIQTESKVLFTVRTKEFEKVLLKKENLPYVVIGSNSRSIFGKLIGVITKNFKLIREVRKFKPNMIISHGSFYAAQVAWLLHIPSLTLEDTGNREQIFLYKYFTQVILTPNSIGRQFSKKQIFYNGLHELAYVTKNIIQSNIDSVIDNKPILVRFVSWGASHDTYSKKLSTIQKIQLINILNSKGKVLITAEGVLPDQLEKYKIKIDPSDFHSILQKSSLVISEGSTTAIEACLLGVPTIYIGDCSPKVMQALVERGMLVATKNISEIIELVTELLSLTYFNSLQNKRNELMSESVDLTRLLIWIIEHYPASINQIKKNPELINNYLLS